MGNYSLTNHINNTLTSYLRTTLFVNSSERIVDTVSPQEIRGETTFIISTDFKWGIEAINIISRAPDGIATIRTYRYADKASPSLGDSWEFGQRVMTDASLAQSFVFACHGGNILLPRFSIGPDGSVAVMYGGNFYSPIINTPILKIDNTNIDELYQSKADMTNYITSGSLTNYVNITSNQSITGKKTCAGGLNIKSQTVSVTTDLNDDILF